MCCTDVCGPRDAYFFDRVLCQCHSPCPPKCCEISRRMCQAIPYCARLKPDRAYPPLGQGVCGYSCEGPQCPYPPFPCDPHPCYPISCRRIPKYPVWPMYPNPAKRLKYKPIGFPKFCCPNPLPIPPMPHCPRARPRKVPRYPFLYGKEWLVPVAEVHEAHCSPILVRNKCCCKARCNRNCCCAKNCRCC